jgi:hypothetical protein
MKNINVDESKFQEILDRWRGLQALIDAYLWETQKYYEIQLNYIINAENNLNEENATILKDLTSFIGLEPVKNSLLNNLYNSNIVIIYSFLENILFDFCDTIKKKNNFPFDVKDINNKGTMASILYLKKGFNIEIENELFLNDFRQIRNCIVHNNNMISDENKNFRNIIDRNEGLKNNYGHLEISDEYIMKLFIKARKILMDILFQIHK